MEKKKRRVCFSITIIGVIIIIIAQTIIMIDDEAIEKKENYIEANVLIAAKKCVNEGKCVEENITFTKLIDEKYLDAYFINEIKDYREKSYVVYPSYDVILIKKSK